MQVASWTAGLEERSGVIQEISWHTQRLHLVFALSCFTQVILEVTTLEDCDHDRKYEELAEGCGIDFWNLLLFFSCNTMDTRNCYKECLV